MPYKHSTFLEKTVIDRRTLLAMTQTASVIANPLRVKQSRIIRPENDYPKERSSFGFFT